MPPNKTVTSVLSKAGTVEYYCRFHPNMKATLVVAPWLTLRNTGSPAFADDDNRTMAETPRGVETVIASGVGSKPVIARSEATKQSIVTTALAVDCFAEPVIGRAFARPVGSQ
jgi:hypothetical protein